MTKYLPYSVLLTYENVNVEVTTKSGNVVTRAIRQPRIRVFQSANEALRQHAIAHTSRPGAGGILEIEPPIEDGFDIADFMSSLEEGDQ